MKNSNDILQINAAVKKTEGIPIPLYDRYDSQVRLICMKELTDKTGLSKATLCDWQNPASPNFKSDMPKRCWLSGVPGKGAVRYLLADVDRWLLDCYNQSQIAEGA